MALKRFAPHLARAKAAFPAIAFFGGFFWDAATLGRSIQSTDLWILLGYLIVSALILIWMGRRGAMHGGGGPEAAISPAAAAGEAHPGSDGSGAAGAEVPKSAFSRVLAWLRDDGPAFALQFCFGSLFSALVIFYFLSSSYLPGFLLVIALVALLVLNEFLESQYHRFTITWTLFGACSILFFNFALPHLVHSIHPLWFFASTAAGVGLIYGLKVLSPRAKGSLWPILATAGALVLLYLVNAIPPVPLVKKNIAICRNLERVDGEYLAEMEKPPIYAFWRRSETLVRQRNGEKIFCFTSVFLPTGIRCTLYHHWYYDDPRKKEWVEASRIGFPVSGGRKDGFRGYTYKRNLAPGAWKVLVETESGRVLGTLHFRAEAADTATSANKAMEFKKLVLD
jgi:hypothetical protein